MKSIIIAACAAALSVISIHAQESVTWDKFNSVSVGLPQIGVVAAPVKDAGSRWSVGCECLDRDYGNFESYSPYLHQLGVGYARIQSGWQKTETRKGKYEFGWLDKIVDGIIAQGLKPWMTLCYGNSLYGAKAELNSTLFSDDKTVQAWTDYVKAVVRRYKGKVVAWEIWNEPLQPEAYANMLVKTCDAIRSIEPEAYILGFANNAKQNLTGEFHRAVLDILRKQNKLDILNAVTYHPYYANPDWGRAVAVNLRKLVDEYNKDMALVQGEAGCPSRLEFSHALKNVEWSEYSQAKWLARRMAVDFGLGTPASIFTFADLVYNNPDTDANFANMQQSFGLLRCNIKGNVVYKRPAFHAVSNMAALLNSRLHAVEVEYKTDLADEISCYGIADQQGRIVGAMIWLSGHRPDDGLEVRHCNLHVKGLAADSLVLVEPVTGRVFNGQSLTCREGRLNGWLRLADMPIWDSPMIILDKSALRYVALTQLNPDKATILD